MLLSFTVLGIYNGFSQKTSVNAADSGPHNYVLKRIMARDSMPLKDRLQVKLFPNPAKNKMEISIKGFEAGFISVFIIDVAGRQQRKDQRMLYSGNEKIPVMFSLQPGVYFIVLKQNGNFVKSRFIVQ